MATLFLQKNHPIENERVERPCKGKVDLNRLSRYGYTSDNNLTGRVMRTVGLQRNPADKSRTNTIIETFLDELQGVAHEPTLSTKAIEKQKTLYSIKKQTLTAIYTARKALRKEPTKCPMLLDAWESYLIVENYKPLKPRIP